MAPTFQPDMRGLLREPMHPFWFFKQQWPDVYLAWSALPGSSCVIVCVLFILSEFPAVVSPVYSGHGCAIRRAACDAGIEGENADGVLEGLTRQDASRG